MIITAISKKNIRTYGKSFEISESRIVLSINFLELSSKVEIIIKKFPYAEWETYIISKIIKSSKNLGKWSIVLNV